MKNRAGKPFSFLKYISIDIGCEFLTEGKSVINFDN